jgi:hypothetical protein
MSSDIKNRSRTLAIGKEATAPSASKRDAVSAPDFVLSIRVGGHKKKGDWE